MSETTNLLTGQSVMIADDEPFNLSIVARMLREMGCNDVVTAADGRDTLRQIEKHERPFAFILLDFNMPGVNGLEILKLIRTGKTSAPRSTHVFMLTGSSDVDLVGAAIALEVDAFLVKPISWAILSGRIEKIHQYSHDFRNIAAYESVPIADVSNRLKLQQPPEPFGHIEPDEPLARRSTGLRVKLDEAPDRAILAEAIRSPNGDLLLAKGTVLSPRLIRRLLELGPVLRVDYVNIFPPRDLR